MSFKAIDPSVESVGKRVIEAAIRVHRRLGPGLLESTYAACLAHELTQDGLEAELQVPLPLIYDSVRLECGYRIDLLVGGVVVVEVKSVDELHPIHTAQMLTYLKLSERRLGYLINFNVLLLKDGLRRYVV